MDQAFPILIVSGANQIRDSLAQVAWRCDLRPVCCQTFAAAKALLARQRFAVVVCDDLLSDGSFHAIIHAGRRSGRQPVIVISSRDDWDSYLLALSAGAFDCLSSTSAAREIEHVLTAALRESRHAAESIASPAA